MSKAAESVVLFVLVVETILINGRLRNLEDKTPEIRDATAGISVTDLDNDGNFEVIVAVYDGPNKVLKFDRGKRKYVDLASLNGERQFEALEDSEGRTLCACACDVDGDGAEEIFLHNDNDVYTNVERVPSRLIKRLNETGEYVDLFSLPGNTDSAPQYGGNSAACIDINGDGVYSIIYTTFTPDGKGIYKLLSITSTSKIVTQTLVDFGKQDVVFNRGRGILVGPIVGEDFLSDVFITNDNSFIVGSSLYRHVGSNVLLVNNGNGTFTDVAKEYGLQDSDDNSRGSCLSDLNNDGNMDLVFTNWLGPTRVYLRQENVSNFESVADDIATQSRAGDVIVANDFNNDGKNELLLMDGELADGVNRLLSFHGGNNSARNVLTSYDIHDDDLHGIPIKGAASADLDGDGVPELFVSHGDSGGRTFSVFQESDYHETEFNWIRILPETKHGAPARGAMITLTMTDSSKRSLVIGGDCSYLCQSEPIAHFGLGKEFARDIVIVWPGGHKIKLFLSLRDNKKVLSVTYSGEIKYLETLLTKSENQSSASETTASFEAFYVFCCLFIQNVFVYFYNSTRNN